MSNVQYKIVLNLFCLIVKCFRLNTDFVCFRGLLTQIMCSLHLREDWTICATKWKDTIYLCAADNKQTYNIPKEEQNKFCSWGYKFEQYMLTSNILKHHAEL